MENLSIPNREMLVSLTWYMEARKTALRSALSFRAPLSAKDRVDMRIHYSGYFLNLLAATELFLETRTLPKNEFKALLNSRFIFDGFEDGDANYSYIRELRNAVVHRGMDITLMAHMNGQIPMPLAIPKINNQKRTKSYFAFDKYLLSVIQKCESIIGSAMLNCLNSGGVFDSTIDTQEAAIRYKEFIEELEGIPDVVKEKALAFDFSPELAIAMHKNFLQNLREALTPYEITI